MPKKFKKTKKVGDDFATIVTPAAAMRFPAIAAKASFQDWKNLFTDVLQCVDATGIATAMTKEKRGVAFAHGMAMEKENKPFFDALYKVVIRHLDFYRALNSKRPASHFAEVADPKKAFPIERNHLSKITFQDLCDSDKYAMRGAVRQLMGEFKIAMLSAGRSIKECDKQHIEKFITEIEAISQPNYKTRPTPARKTRQPEMSAA